MHVGPAEPEASAAHLAVRMEGIGKSFGSVVALNDAAFRLGQAEVHALVGENGAGKTTLMNILSGLYLADRGSVWIHGDPVELRSPQDAIAHRVGMVHQHFELVPPFTGLENIILGAPQGWWKLDADQHRAAVTDLAARYGLDIELDAPVMKMEVGDRQKVEILRVLYAGARVLILDEPTTHLTPNEVDRLFEGVRLIVEESGLAVVLIAHKLHEVIAMADRMTVLRKGRVVGELEKEEFDEDRIVELIVGKASGKAVSQGASHADLHQERLALDAVSAEVDPPGVPLEEIGLTCHRGELVGVAGVAGNGQTELLQTIVGLISPVGGTIRLDGADITGLSIRQRLAAGLVALPADRLREGIIPDAPLYESYGLGLHHLWRAEQRWSRSFIQGRARECITRLNIVAPHERIPTGLLSGGNIQRLLVGRALAIMEQARSGVLLAMNPTNGLDVSATVFVRSEMQRLCSEGKSVLLISEDLDELLLLCDRIVVLHAGALAGEFARPDFDRYAIGARMLGRRSKAGAES